jgi:5'-nucleotidase
MKFRYLFISVLCCFAFSAFAQKHLTILHTNDTHSCVLPLKPTLADTLLAGRAGFLRRISMIEQERAKDKSLLLFDSGDFSQGSPFYTLFKGDVEIGLMNRMHYDAGTIGNHEFDFGMQNMARIFKKANFPILCSNYDVKGTPLDGVVKTYTILKKNGVKIGVFALDPKLEGLVSKANYGTIKYLDPLTVANEMAAMLKNEKKCDLVICISHLGWEEKGMGDQMMIAGSRNIDLVLGGHSHTYFKTLRYVKNLDGKDIPVDQNGKNAIYVGKMILNLTQSKK